MTSDDATISWRRLWSETAAVVGDRAQARWLCEVASGADGDEFRQALDEPATERMVAHLDAMLARLRAGEPLQYVLGRWGFRRLDLFVDRRVLIPRPETEQVVEAAISLGRSIAPPFVAVDLGTGSGAIGLSLAAELGELVTQLWLTDASVDALDVARANISGIGRHAPKVRIAHGDWFAALPDELAGEVGLVVSNPPYVCDGDERLEPLVADWEPASALFAGADGLDAVRRIAADVTRWLRPDGWLVLEIGAGQGDAVTAILAAAGLVDVEVRSDLAGHDRTAIGRQPNRAAT